MAESWPAEGLPLAEALWRIEPDPRFHINECNAQSNAWDTVAGGLDLFGSMVATSTLRRNRVRRLCALLTKGRYTMKGRRGSPTAESQDIPASALPYFDFDRADHSEFMERKQKPMGPDGPHWFDVRVYARVPEPEPASASDLPPNAAGASGDEEPSATVKRVVRDLLNKYSKRPATKVDALAYEFNVSPSTMERALRVLRTQQPDWD
jgi:hypothetical protein